MKNSTKPPHFEEVTAQFILKIDRMTNLEFEKAIGAPPKYLSVPAGLPKEFHAKWLAMEMMAYDAVKWQKTLDFVKRGETLPIQNND